MKIGNDLYGCGFCGNTIKKKVKKYISEQKGNKGKSNVSEQLICDNCGRYVLQKTKLEIDMK